MDATHFSRTFYASLLQLFLCGYTRPLAQDDSREGNAGAGNEFAEFRPEKTALSDVFP